MEWRLLDKHQAYENEEQTRLELERQKQKQREYRRVLDAQVRPKAAEERTELFLEEWKEELEKQKRKAKKKNMEEKEARDVQVATRLERQQKEDRERYERERREVEDCQKALERERREALERKTKERQRMLAVQEEQRKEQARRQQVRLAEALEDQRLMEAFKQKLDREEEQRQNAFSMRMQRLEQFSTKSKTKGAGYQEALATKQFEDRVAHDASLKEHADLERERRDIDVAKSKLQACALENQRLVQDKRQREAQRSQEEHKFASRFVKDSQDYLREEAAKIIANRQHMRQHQSLLKQQIDAKQKSDDTMDDRERALNKSLLEQARRKLGL